MCKHDTGITKQDAGLSSSLEGGGGQVSHALHTHTITCMTSFYLNILLIPAIYNMCTFDIRTTKQGAGLFHL